MNLDKNLIKLEKYAKINDYLDKSLIKLKKYAKRTHDCRESHIEPDKKCNTCDVRYDCWTGTEFLDLLNTFMELMKNVD